MKHLTPQYAGAPREFAVSCLQFAVANPTANPTANRKPRTAIPPSGFTLVETMVAAIIISLAVLSIVAAQQAYHRQSDVAQQMATALSLATELREAMLNLPLNDPSSGNATFGPESNEWTGTAAGSVSYFDDLDDFAGPSGSGLTFSPPINAQRLPIADMTRWTQVVSVENVDPTNLSGPAVANGSTDLLRVTVIVKYQEAGATTSREITRLSWIVAAPQG